MRERAFDTVSASGSWARASGAEDAILPQDVVKAAILLGDDADSTAAVAGGAAGVRAPRPGSERP